MTTHGVDVRTPIFYRHSFANVLEAQSGKVYARFTHTPLIAEHLRHGAVSGALIEQYAATHLHTLVDLEKLLCAVLDDTFGAHASLHHPPTSVREGGSDELNATILSPSSVLLQGSAARAEDGTGGEEAAKAGSRPRGVDADARRVQPAHPRGCGEFAVEQEACTSPSRLPLPVSLPADPPLVAPSFEEANSDKQKASVAAGASVHGAASHLWERLRGWARRTDTIAAAPLPRSTSNISLSAAAANSNAARARRTRVPQWVRTPFAPTPALSAAPVSTSVSAAPVMGWLRSPVPVLSVSPSESAAASQRAETHHTTSSGEVVITQSSQPRNTADMYDDNDVGGGRARQRDDGDTSSHLTQTPRRYTHGPSPAEQDPTSMSLSIQVTSGPFTSTASHTNAHEKRGASTADARRTHAVVSPSKVVSMAATAASETAGDGINVPAASSPTTTQLAGNHHTRQNGTGVSGEQLSEDRLLSRSRHGGSGGASGMAAGASTDLRSAGPSLSFSHTWHTGDAQAPLTSPATTCIPRRRTSAASCWDRRAYATELVGWLHLLVWVRWQVIHFLRDLSGVQGFVAWSAWYWSWAQEHSRQAAFHQALSASFWRGVWLHGLHAQLNQVQYEVSRHMFTLQSVFQLIVSYIGAVYTALEQLNTLLMQVQRSFEVMMSPVAAAAAVAVARAPVATAGSSCTASPLPANYANTHRGGGVWGCDFNANQNSMFWSPIAAGVGRGRASSRTQGSRDRAGSPQRGDQSAFASDAAPATPHARRGLHDEAERESDISFFEEEVEAASLHAMDELRRGVWSTLQELKTMFCPDGRPLDALEVNEQQARFPWGGGGGGLSAAGPATASIARPDSEAGLHPSDENALLGMPALDEAAPAAQSSGHQVHFAEAGTPSAHDGSGLDGGHPASVREGARVLLQCVQCSQALLRRLTVLVQRAHSPPTARHWRRILVAAVTIVPPFMWVYTKSPTELAAIARKTVTVGRQVLWSYVVDPVMQLRESLFYVRPGVEDRRGAVERDAVSLANIIRDFHEDMYPDMSQKRLEELRDRTFKRLRAGVADPEGLGLIDEQYRHSVRHPIRSVLFGHLPRIMLIQLSYQALEVSRVANGIDEVLEGNDINFKIMAMMPVFLAGGLLATWGLFRYRFKYKPVRLRMKLLWRSLFRVISFAGNGQGLVLPFLRISAQQQGIRPHAEATALVVDFPRVQTNLARVAGRRRSTKARRHVHSHRAAVGATLGSSLPSRNTERGGSGDMDAIDTAAFSESGRDSESSSDESRSASGSAVTARELNNYEQGMVLLLSHVMRSIAAEYLRSYAFFHELMEDFNDLESVQSTRRQRLATLTRMRATHTYFF